VACIVFHGDADATVDVGNGAEIVRRAVVREEASAGPLHEVIENRVIPHGHAYTATRYLRGSALPVVEYWVVHGAGHAWSGGSPDGSFTDDAGPDASAEMVRFFLSQ
jgi:poly(3-hydroxybutyrate) depolymerase